MRFSISVILILSVCTGCWQDCCPAPSPDTVLEPSRWIDLEGVVNARDLGGYLAADGKTVRWQTVYRSAAMAWITEQGCLTFAGLGIRTVVDFRNRLSAVPLFDGDAICVHCCADVILLRVRPVDDETYSSTFLGNIDSFRQAFLLLAEPDALPLLFHCGGGVDRAGMFAALLLEALGVSREDINTDYLLSPHARNRPHAIGDFLAFIDQQGGVESLLASMDIPAAALAAVRGNLLE